MLLFPFQSYSVDSCIFAAVEFLQTRRKYSRGYQYLISSAYVHRTNTTYCYETTTAEYVCAVA